MIAFAAPIARRLRAAAAATLLVSIAAASVPARAQSEDPRILVVASTTERYPVGMRLPLSAQITLKSDEKLKLFMPNRSTRVVEGETNGPVDKLPGAKTPPHKLWDILAGVFGGRERDDTSASYRGGRLIINGDAIGFTGSEKDPTVICVAGDVAFKLSEIDPGGNRVRIRKRGRVLDTIDVTPSKPVANWPEKPSAGSEYEFSVLPSGGKTHLRFAVVKPSVLQRGEDRFIRLLENGCGAQARAEAAF